MECNFKDLVNRCAALKNLQPFKQLSEASKTACFNTINSLIPLVQKKHFGIFYRGLEDPDAATRLLSITVFYHLCLDRRKRKMTVDYLVQGLDVFVYLVNDEKSICLKAIAVVTEIVTQVENALDVFEWYKIMELGVMSMDDEIVKATGKFTNKLLYQRKRFQVQSGKLMSDYSHSAIITTSLVCSGEYQKAAPYMLDLVIHSSPFLTNWKCYTDLLIEEPIHRSDRLTVQQTRDLLTVMLLSIQYVATGRRPYGRVTTSNESQPHSNPSNGRKEITEHFIGVLPKLLQKYKNSFSMTLQLLLIPTYFDVETLLQSSDRLLQLVECILKTKPLYHEDKVFAIAQIRALTIFYAHIQNA